MLRNPRPGRTYLYAACHQCRGHSPTIASSGSGFPGKATTFVSAGRDGATKKFNGHQGSRLRLKLMHHSSGQNCISVISREMKICSLRCAASTLPHSFMMRSYM